VARPEPVSVVVAVLTYKRPDTLAKLLPVLVRQARAIDAAVLVVDNDPDAGAASVIPEGSPSCRYVHEPAPGIAAARNRALSEAAGSDALVFIDDDEMPTEGWLAELVARWQEWRCAAVAGPVRPVYPDQVDPWIPASGVLVPPERANGARVKGTGTGNLLLDLRQVTALGIRFDERFGLTGGSDTKFVYELVRAGGEIRWAEAALVWEPVSSARLSRRWMLRRMVRTGSSWSRVMLALAEPEPAARARLRLELTARGVVRFARGLGRFARGVLTSDLERRARGECDVASALGCVLGAYGVSVYDYARPSAA
jgi:GT2 family glycosyltransferase